MSRQEHYTAGFSHYRAGNYREAADHLANVAFAIKSTDGAQLEDLKQRSKEIAKQRNARKKIYW